MNTAVKNLALALGLLAIATSFTTSNTSAQTQSIAQGMMEIILLRR